MAPHKAAHESGKQPVSKSIQAHEFVADCLPPELIHKVFVYLRPTEAAALRRAGRAAAADIGLEYLAPTIYLRLNEEESDRLFATANHPAASKHVVNIE